MTRRRWMRASLKNVVFVAVADLGTLAGEQPTLNILRQILVIRNQFRSEMIRLLLLAGLGPSSIGLVLLCLGYPSRQFGNTRKGGSDFLLGTSRCKYPRIDG